jgi:hypothetical protein
MSQPPRVFISYSHDDDAHREFVLRLANRLRTEQGIECLLDQHFLPGFPPQGWTKWMRDSVRDAKHVLMVCTPKYRNRYERNLENLEDTGRGVAFEGVVISQTLYEDYFHNHGLKFIPVLPSNGKREDVPRELRDFSIYTLPDAFQQVCDLIRGVQYNPLPPLGSPPAQDNLEARVDAYLNWVQNSFLHDMNAYTEMDGIQRLRAEPDVCRITFIGAEDDEFADLDDLCEGLPERQLREEKTFGNILDALVGVRQGIFLGKPGAGKSTTLWKLAHDEIQQNRVREQRIVPVILRLGFWVQAEQPLLEFIHAQTNIDAPKLGDAFAELLAQQRILLILDGLNEMPISQQQSKGRQIRDFLAAYPQLWAYASCREDDYSDVLRLPLPELHIQPLSIPKIKSFIHSYLQAKGIPQAGEAAEKLFWDIAGGQELQAVWQVWEQAGATSEQFWSGEDIPRENPNVYGATTGEHDRLWESKIRDNPQNLMRLARNPYLLAMLMRIGKPGQAFPQNRGKLLAKFYQQLVKREADKKNKPKNNAELLQDGGTQLEALIGKLAWAMQTQTSASQHETLTLMGHDGRWLKLAIRCNVLEQIGDSIRFSHQLLQDYFIAVGMKQRLDVGQLSAERFWQQSGNWWEPTGWEEPVVLLAGLYQDDCSPVIRWLERANPKLAARCIRESGVPCVDVTKASLQPPWLARLSNLDTDPNPHARAAIGTALAWVSLHGRSLDQRKGVGLDAAGLPDIDWVEIPAGEFIYQKDERLSLPTYQMSRYPVTNAQFQAFVMADDGYGNDGWWQDLQKPETPHESRWKESNRPVEQVDWYEAMAYCRWLSKKMDLDIRLPTEEQWEKAARGTDGWEYPWGEGYKTGYANIDETWKKDGDFYLQETSAVGIYPQGQSPYGLMDMAGNVWEWCLNKYEEPQITTADVYGGVRVVRGGAWGNSTVSCRSSSRYLRRPLDRLNDRGFRLVVLLSPH